MHATSDSTTPSRSGLKRLISPWEYRHLHASMAARFAFGGFQLGIGLVLVSLGRKAETDAERRKYYRLAAWFLVPAAGNFAGGLLDLSVARTAPPPS
jgi:low temperature requirement protein LtrA